MFKECKQSRSSQSHSLPTLTASLSYKSFDLAKSSATIWLPSRILGFLPAWISCWWFLSSASTTWRCRCSWRSPATSLTSHQLAETTAVIGSKSAREIPNAPRPSPRAAQQLLTSKALSADVCCSASLRASNSTRRASACDRGAWWWR